MATKKPARPRAPRKTGLSYGGGLHGVDVDRARAASAFDFHSDVGYRLEAMGWHRDDVIKLINRDSIANEIERLRKKGESSSAAANRLHAEMKKTFGAPATRRGYAKGSDDSEAARAWLEFYRRPGSIIFAREPGGWDVLQKLVRSGRIAPSGAYDAAGSHPLYQTVDAATRSGYGKGATNIYASDESKHFSDCVNYKKNPLGDCGGRAITNGRTTYCETCFNRGSVPNGREYMFISRGEMKPLRRPVGSPKKGRAGGSSASHVRTDGKPVFTRKGELAPGDTLVFLHKGKEERGEIWGRGVGAGTREGWIVSVPRSMGSGFGVIRDSDVIRIEPASKPGRAGGMLGKNAPADGISIGDTLVYTRPPRRGIANPEVRGRVVMRGPAGWVVNAGGRHGTPDVVDDERIVRVIPARLKNGRAAGLTAGYTRTGYAAEVKRQLAARLGKGPRGLSKRILDTIRPMIREGYDVNESPAVLATRIGRAYGW